MRATRPKPPSSEAAPGARRLALISRTGETIQQSGIYRVHHSQHRLPHEVTLLEGEQFPRCARCADQVAFELIHPAQAHGEHDQLRIVLYELPALEEQIAAR